MLPEYFETDESESQFESELIDIDVRFEPSDLWEESSVIASWVTSPEIMFGYLVDQLNVILADCEYRLFDKLILQLKPERLKPACFDSVDLHFDAARVDLVNLIRKTPLNGESLRTLGCELVAGNSHALDHAFEMYKRELQKLNVWIGARQLLSDLPKSQSIEKQARKPTAQMEDVEAAIDTLQKQSLKPTKEALGALLRERGFTLSNTKLNTMKNRAEKQSAVRPPDSAD